MVCDMLAAGDTFNLNGDTYKVVNITMLVSMRNNGEDLTTVCVSLVTDMAYLFSYSVQFNSIQSGHWELGCLQCV